MDKKTRQALMNWKIPEKDFDGLFLKPNHYEVVPDETKTIPQQLEAIAEAICNNYCRYPLTWNEEVDGELADSEICANCPLNKLT